MSKKKLIINYLVNSFIKNGNRIFAEKLIFSVICELKKVYGKRYLFVLYDSVKNFTPKVKLRNKKKSGIIYKIPYLLNENEGLSYAFKWFRLAVKERKEFTLKTRILKEILDAYKKKGLAVKKKNALHELALNNRGFIKFLK